MNLFGSSTDEQTTGTAAGQRRVETGGQKAPAPVAIAVPRLTQVALSGYPTQARALVTQHLTLLRDLPLPLLPLLLREIRGYDWHFPRERERINAQLVHLASLDPAQRVTLVAPFASLHLPASLNAMNWVTDPNSYLDALTAALWSSGQMPTFREAAKAYAAAIPAPDAATRRPRLVVAVLDSSLTGTVHFARLRPHGTALRIQDKQGTAVLLAHLQQRAEAQPARYSHWYIDGGTVATMPDTAVTTISYDALAPVRAALLARARDAMNGERSGPEELRSLMAHTTPDTIGMGQDDPTLAHFQLSLLTEGSGTQIFSTTFTQWAARECLRRAEPDTLALRFAPRQEQQGMDQMLAGAIATGLDPAGSLIDAEQGAYYTFLNLSRLSGAQEAHFLAWHVSSGLAVAAGPGFARGASTPTTYTMDAALRLLS